MNSLERIATLPAVQEVGDALIGVIFAKSPSRSYTEAVTVAKRARVYGESTLGKKLFHYAVFGRDKSQTSLAIMVTNKVNSWKDTKFFLRGRLLTSNNRIEEVLKCYLDSLEPQDSKAHCHCVFRYLSAAHMNDVLDGAVNRVLQPMLFASHHPILAKLGLTPKPKRPSEPERYLIPCRLLEGFVEHALFREGSPTEDHLQALATRRNSFWCPHFNSSSFQRIAD